MSDERRCEFCGRMDGDPAPHGGVAWCAFAGPPPRATRWLCSSTCALKYEARAAAAPEAQALPDAVNHPAHYTAHPSGVECITVAEHMTFNIGSAVKYLWRAGLKSADAIEDLRKAEWYVRREIERLQKSGGNDGHRA